jgi:hypothetical protein
MIGRLDDSKQGDLSGPKPVFMLIRAEEPTTQESAHP